MEAARTHVTLAPGEMARFSWLATWRRQDVQQAAEPESPGCIGLFYLYSSLGPTAQVAVLRHAAILGGQDKVAEWMLDHVHVNVDAACHLPCLCPRLT
ncbi:hypothetical protein Ct61P_15057 [Colletotrichum tofieldiae]|nr:hypothetical protein Ct61P_15057 [Colletotrichum tofieldiae]